MTLLDWTLEQFAEVDQLNAESQAASGVFEVSWFTPAPGDPPPAVGPRDELVYLAAQLVARARPGLHRDQLDAHGTRALAEQIVELIDAATTQGGAEAAAAARG